MDDIAVFGRNAPSRLKRLENPSSVLQRKILPNEKRLRVFLCGDAMIGRGVDQILPDPCDPELHERYVKFAIDYVRLAERAHGPLPRSVDAAYLWGDACGELARLRPDLRIANLETAITRSDNFANKEVTYRISPDNARCLLALGLHCCVLANNHILDFGSEGLRETLDSLRAMKISFAGAGLDLDEAQAPAILKWSGGRVLVYSIASEDSGAPAVWAATKSSPGVEFIDWPSPASGARLAERIKRFRKKGDIVIVSVHWGPNWGYRIEPDARAFAHTLIEDAGVSIVHGHSSHHPKPIEYHHDRLILYGCGDFLNDYEGIESQTELRSDLALSYVVDIEPATGRVVSLEMTPFRIRRFRLERASRDDGVWLHEQLNRRSAPLGAQIDLVQNGALWARPRHAPDEVLDA